MGGVGGTLQLRPHRGPPPLVVLPRSQPGSERLGAGLPALRHAALLTHARRHQHRHLHAAQLHPELIQHQPRWDTWGGGAGCRGGRERPPSWDTWVVGERPPRWDTSGRAGCLGWTEGARPASVAETTAGAGAGWAPAERAGWEKREQLYTNRGGLSPVAEKPAWRSGARAMARRVRRPRSEALSTATLPSLLLLSRCVLFRDRL